MQDESINKTPIIEWTPGQTPAVIPEDSSDVRDERIEVLMREVDTLKMQLAMLESDVKQRLSTLEMQAETKTDATTSTADDGFLDRMAQSPSDINNTSHSVLGWPYRFRPKKNNTYPTTVDIQQGSWIGTSNLVTASATAIGSSAKPYINITVERSEGTLVDATIFASDTEADGSDSNTRTICKLNYTGYGGLAQIERYVLGDIWDSGAAGGTYVTIWHYGTGDETVETTTFEDGVVQANALAGAGQEWYAAALILNGDVIELHNALRCVT